MDGIQIEVQRSLKPVFRSDNFLLRQQTQDCLHAFIIAFYGFGLGHLLRL